MNEERQEPFDRYETQDDGELFHLGIDLWKFGCNNLFHDGNVHLRHQRDGQIMYSDSDHVGGVIARANVLNDGCEHPESIFIIHLEHEPSCDKIHGLNV